MISALVMLIVGDDEDPALVQRTAAEQRFQVFPESDSLQALQAIEHQRPRLVVLNEAFAKTARGALLIQRVQTNSALAHCQIRTLHHAIDYVRLVDQADQAEQTAVGLPLPTDYLGTRTAPRIKMPPGVTARLDGNEAKLIDLSARGARVMVSTAIRPFQRVRFTAADAHEQFRCSGAVAWVVFEPARGSAAPHYVAGLEFYEPDTALLERFCNRYRGS